MNRELLARRAEVRILVGGVDITEDIRQHFLSMTYTDSEEDESDDLQIQLQDRGGLWLQSWLEEAVRASAASKLAMSAVILPEHWDSGGALPTGEFELDSVEASGPPSIINISGASLPYGSSVRQTRKSRAWEAYTLQGIATEIARKNGLRCMYLAKGNRFYERVEQTKESDIKFLRELCHDEGISLKCTDGQLVLFDQADYEARPPALLLRNGNGRILPAKPEAYGAYGRRGDCAEYTSYNLSTGAAETQYGSCRVSCADPATKTCVEGTAFAEGDDGNSGQRLEITARVRTKEEAVALAEKQLRLHNKFNRTASFTMPGNTALVAGVTVWLEGFGGWDGRHIIKQAVHTVSGGYTTKITTRQVL